tara:strand:+ start:724 stop:2853 length:2130 start_codon:yes stop_codon:yes gene_type:complete
MIDFTHNALTGPGDGSQRIPYVYENDVFTAAHGPLTYTENPDILSLYQIPMGEAATLPPVAQRMCDEPLVVSPAQSIGHYGSEKHHTSKAWYSGTWESFLAPTAHNFFTLSLDSQQSYVDFMLKGHAFNADFTQVSWTLRKGMRWSNGDLLDAADVCYWRDLNVNSQLTRKSGAVIDMLDDVTECATSVDATGHEVATYTFNKPYPNLLGMSTYSNFHLAAPKKFFAPFYASDSALAKSLGFSDGDAVVRFYRSLDDKYERMNPYLACAISDAMAESWSIGGWFADLPQFHLGADRCTLYNNLVNNGHPKFRPTLGPFMIGDTATCLKTGAECTQGSTRTLVPNPYYCAVDTTGQQLPYYSKIVDTYTNDDLDYAYDRVFAGQVDVMHQLIPGSDAALMKAFETTGDYIAHMFEALGSEAISFNFNYGNITNAKDRKIATLFQNQQFRKAMSIAMDRRKYNKALYLGQASEVVFCSFSNVGGADDIISDETRYSFGAGTHNTSLAKSMVDAAFAAVDLTLSEFTLDFIHPTSGLDPVLMQLIADDWRALGMTVVVTPMETEAYKTLLESGTELMIHTGACGGKSYTEAFAEMGSTLKLPLGTRNQVRNGVKWAEYLAGTTTEPFYEPPAWVTQMHAMIDEVSVYSSTDPAAFPLVKALCDFISEHMVYIGTLYKPRIQIINNRIKNAIVKHTTPEIGAYQNQLTIQEYA